MNLGHRLALAANQTLAAENERLRTRVAELEEFLDVISAEYPIDLTDTKVADTEER